MIAILRRLLGFPRRHYLVDGTDRHGYLDHSSEDAYSKAEATEQAHSHAVGTDWRVDRVYLDERSHEHP